MIDTDAVLDLSVLEPMYTRVWFSSFVVLVLGAAPQICGSFSTVALGFCTFHCCRNKKMQQT